VNGNVVVAPPQLPESARRRLDAMVMIIISAITSAARNVERRLAFIAFFLVMVDARFVFRR
jgi:hypothetical protein